MNREKINICHKSLEIPTEGFMEVYDRLDGVTREDDFRRIKSHEKRDNV